MQSLRAVLSTARFAVQLKYLFYWVYMKIKDIALISVLMLLWSADFLSIKGVSEYPVMARMAIRFTIASLVFIPFFRTPPVPLKHLLSLSAVYALGHVAMLMLSIRIGIGIATLAFIEVLATPMCLVIGVAFLKERLSLRAWIGIYCAILNAACCCWCNGRPWLACGTSCTYCTRKYVCMGSVQHLHKSCREEIPPLGARTLWMDSILLYVDNRGVVCNFERDEWHKFANITGHESALIALNVLSNIIFHPTLYYLLQSNSLSTISLCFLANPFISGFFAYLFFNESFGWIAAICGIFVCLGAALTTSNDAFNSSKAKQVHL